MRFIRSESGKVCKELAVLCNADDCLTVFNLYRVRFVQTDLYNDRVAGDTCNVLGIADRRLILI